MWFNYSVVATFVFLVVAGSTGAALIYASAGRDNYVSGVGGVPEDEALGMDFQPLVVPAVNDGRVYAYIRIDMAVRLVSEPGRLIVASQAPRLHAALIEDFYQAPIRWVKSENGVDHADVQRRLLAGVQGFLGRDVVNDVEITQIWLAHR